MDEKLLEEIRRQEEALNAPPPEDEEESQDDELKEEIRGNDIESNPLSSAGDTKQTTLFGGDY